MTPATVVLVMGTFDLLHHGHINLLRSAACLGEVTVAVNTSDFVHEYKGRYPVQTLHERMEALKGVRYVHDVVVNEGGYDAKVTIRDVNPRWLVHGDDWTGDSYLRQLGVTQDWLREHDVALHYVPYTEGVSTSDLIERCKVA
jgi:glycerol-3-phosphate cytidylyltransferase